MRRSKYGNVKCKAHGLTFDSKVELARYRFLMEQARDGKISGLRHHVEFPCVVNGIEICKYEADFLYGKKGGKIIIEDVKGVQTAVFRIKKKLMLACNGLEIRIVKSPTEAV